jgi:O-glycosyl hydrolase
MIKRFFFIFLVFAAALTACSRSAKPEMEDKGVTEFMEKITVINGAVPVYAFTLPQGETFGNYTRITAQFLVDNENYVKLARARAYGTYRLDDFADIEQIKFIDFGGGDMDKNVPYLVSNVIGADVNLDTVSGSAGANTWFTLEFPLYGKRHQNYNPGHFPAADASGVLYFGAGLGTGNASRSFTYYIKNVIMSSDDGTRIIPAAVLEKPAFAGYSSGITALRREESNAALKTAPVKEKGGPVKITVDTAQKRQYVTGFGGMSNAWNSPALTEADITAMYGGQGLGYNIFRIIIYHDPARWGELLAVAKKAQSYGAFILASPWSPPPELKSGKSHIGGYLLPQNYVKYAEHLGAFVQYMADNGVTINAVSFQNEPDIKVNYDSCDWTPEQMLNFVRVYGRAIGNVKIIPGESFQFKREFTDPLLDDPLAASKFDIVGGHIYGGGLAPYPLAHEKGKEVWMTEHLLNTHGNYAYDVTWKAALTLAREIHDCMSADFNAYVWWYLKRFYSMLGDGENGSANGEVLRRGYVLSHYAKYATGKQRVQVKAEGNSNILVTAYESDGIISLVVINLGITASKASIQLPGQVQSGDGVESGEEAAMRQADVQLAANRKSATVTLAPQSIVSLRFMKKR